MSIDPEILGDFLAEAGELIERLDTDVLTLETAPDDRALLDSIFRSIHTIKGAASFLDLHAITKFTHAAEDALNMLRKGEIECSMSTVDILLKSVDVVRRQISALGEGDTPEQGPQELVDRLHQLASGGGKQQAEAAATTQTNRLPTPPFGGTVSPLVLPSQKLDLLEFMVDDLVTSVNALRSHLGSATDAASLNLAIDACGQTLADLRATVEFFDLVPLVNLLEAFAAVEEPGRSIADAAVAPLRIRLDAVCELMVIFGSGMRENAVFAWPVDTLHERITALLSGSIEPDWVAATPGDVRSLIVFDGVGQADGTADDQNAYTNDPADAADTEADDSDAAASGPSSAQADNAGRSSAAEQARTGSGGAEQSIRVEVSKLEELLNLVGEMVLAKNQVLGMTRQLRTYGVPAEFVERAVTTASDLDRLTSELQVSAMRTRMQPLHKLFGRYPRIVRDLARKTNKKVSLEIRGGDTEVDKSVLELLGDPLVHMIRNSIDHGIEMPADRDAAGKRQVGTITLSAEHQGGHVRVVVSDDGKGLRRDIIGGKAVEKGLITEEQLASMSDDEIFGFIFAPGFSTAAQVTDLSGRGVGMDVVRTNLSKMNGQISVKSPPNAGTTVEMMIPLTVAIMPALIVVVGANQYAVPLHSIVEIFRHNPADRHMVGGRAVTRLRDRVLPLIDVRERLDEARTDHVGRFSVVVRIGQEMAGLLVDDLVEQQEIVIKSLDEDLTNGPFSGSTIREDGEVSLILDVLKLVRSATLDEEASGLMTGGAA